MRAIVIAIVLANFSFGVRVVKRPRGKAEEEKRVQANMGTAVDMEANTDDEQVAEDPSDIVSKEAASEVHMGTSVDMGVSAEDQQVAVDEQVAADPSDIVSKEVAFEHEPTPLIMTDSLRPERQQSAVDEMQDEVNDNQQSALDELQDEANENYAPGNHGYWAALMRVCESRMNFSIPEVQGNPVILRDWVVAQFAFLAEPSSGAQSGIIRDTESDRLDIIRDRALLRLESLMYGGLTTTVNSTSTLCAAMSEDLIPMEDTAKCNLFKDDFRHALAIEYGGNQTRLSETYLTMVDDTEYEQAFRKACRLVQTTERCTTAFKWTLLEGADLYRTKPSLFEIELCKHVEMLKTVESSSNIELGILGNTSAHNAGFIHIVQRERSRGFRSLFGHLFHHQEKEETLGGNPRGHPRRRASRRRTVVVSSRQTGHVRMQRRRVRRRDRRRRTIGSETNPRRRTSCSCSACACARYDRRRRTLTRPEKNWNSQQLAECCGKYAEDRGMSVAFGLGVGQLGVTTSMASGYAGKDNRGWCKWKSVKLLTKCLTTGLDMPSVSFSIDWARFQRPNKNSCPDCPFSDIPGYALTEFIEFGFILTMELGRIYAKSNNNLNPLDIKHGALIGKSKGIGFGTGISGGLSMCHSVTRGAQQDKFFDIDERKDCPSSCFPADATVLTTQGVKSMGDLHVGDAVLAVDDYGRTFFDDVYMFGHSDAKVNSLMYKINLHTMSADAQEFALFASGDHFLPVCPSTFQCSWSERINIYARQVRVGDIVWVTGEDGREGRLANVDSVGMEQKSGLFNPYTLSGNIIVNGVVASAHSSWILDRFAFGQSHQSLPEVYQVLFWPGRMLYMFFGPQAADALGLNNPQAPWRLTSLASTVTAFVVVFMVRIARRVQPGRCVQPGRTHD